MTVDRNDLGELCTVADVDFHFTTLALNTEKGGYLENADLSGPLDVTFGGEHIVLAPSDLLIAGMPLSLAADFSKEKTDTSYIEIASAAVGYAPAQSILPAELREKLADFHVTGDFPVTVRIATPLTRGSDPKLDIDFQLSGQDVRIKQYEFQKVFADGHLVNRLAVAEGGIADSRKNMRVTASDVKAYYLGDVLIETPFAIVGVPGRDAILHSRLHLSGPARSVSDYLRNDAFFFRRGSFTLDADVNASLLDFEALIQTTDGRIDFYNTEVFYEPAGVSFPFREIHAGKSGEDIRYDIRSKPLRTGFAFDLDGKIDNIVPLLIDLPTQRITTQVNFHSDRFDWKDFRALFGENGRFVSDDEELNPDTERGRLVAGADAGSRKVGKKKKIPAEQVDEATDAEQVAAMKIAMLGLENAFHPNFHMTLDTVKYYDIFTLTDFNTGLNFQRDTLVLERTTFNWSGSEMRFGARLGMNEANVTPFSVEFLADHLDVNRLRTSLEYFGMALPEGLEVLPSDLHVDFAHSGKIADSIGIVPGYNYGHLAFDDGRDELFTGTVTYAPSDTPGGLQTKVHLSGDPRVVNVLFAAENFFFGEGRFTIDLDLDGTPEDLPGLLRASTMNLSIDSSKVLYRPAEVYFPIRHFDVSVAEERADYSLSMVTDSTNRTIHLDGFMDRMTAFMFPDSSVHTEPFRMKADVRADELSYPDIVGLIETRNDNLATRAEARGVDSTVAISKAPEVSGSLDTTVTTLRKILSATGGVFNSFRPDLSLKVDRFILSPRTTLLDLATGMRVRNDNELVLERTGFLIDDGRVELDAVYALDSLAQSPFHVNYRIEDIDLDQLLDEVSKVDSSIKAKIGSVAGRLNLTGEMTGVLDETIQQIVIDSTRATINYDLRDIVLTDWPQLTAIGKKAKMAKRFERLGLGPVTGTLRMEDGFIPVPRTEIQSTALQLFIEGGYSLEEGPDLLISVPVWRNIGRGILREAPEPEGYALSGWKIFLTLTNDKETGAPATGIVLSRRKLYKQEGRLEEYRALRAKWRAERKAAKEGGKE